MRQAMTSRLLGGHPKPHLHHNINPLENPQSTFLLGPVERGFHQHQCYYALTLVGVEVCAPVVTAPAFPAMTFEFVLRAS